MMMRMTLTHRGNIVSEDAQEIFFFLNRSVE